MCACKPEEGIKCMLHFDLDRHIINEAMQRKAELYIHTELIGEMPPVDEEWVEAFKKGAEQ